MINAEKKTVELWELHGLIPAAKSIKKICDLFELPLEYFGEYYFLYFKHPKELFIGKRWNTYRVEKNNFTECL